MTYTFLNVTLFGNLIRLIWLGFILGYVTSDVYLIRANLRDVAKGEERL